MYWPSRTDFVSTIPLSAWWYVLPQNGRVWAETKVCATTGEAIIARVQKILRDGLRAPWTDSQGLVHATRPLVNGVLDDTMLEALWAYACRCAGVPDVNVPIVGACADPLYNQDEGSRIKIPSVLNAAIASLLELAREGVYLSCARDRLVKGSPSLARLVRPDNAFVATRFFTAGLVWLAYYTDTLDATGQQDVYRPAQMGAIPRSSIVFSLRESAGMPAHEPVDAAFFQFLQQPPDPAQLARLATLRPMCSLAKDMAVPDSLKSDAAFEWSSLANGMPQGSSSLSKSSSGGVSKSGNSIDDRLTAIEEGNRRQAAEIARAQAEADSLVRQANADIASMRTMSAQRATQTQQSLGIVEIPIPQPSSNRSLMMVVGLALIGYGLMGGPK